MSKSITYEFPLNEKMRNFMRLESSFKMINYFSHKQESWDSQACVFGLLEIINILERSDVKTEIIQELERNHISLSHLLNTPAVNLSKLESTLSNLEEKLQKLQLISGKVAINLREDELLNSIKQKMSVSATINQFDIPGLYYWLNLPIDARQVRILNWLKELTPIYDSIALLLEMVRGSATFTCENADAGFFQKSLNPSNICQMVRIENNEGSDYFPEFSGSKHRINIRFLKYVSNNQRPQQVSKDISFNLACCVI